jgi:von Willebrand factor A domain-containing protein 8
LNNILENREMALEDGSFIMGHSAFDQLVASGTHTEAELKSRRLLRCHPDFRVIALGLPVPPYPGRYALLMAPTLPALS